jgi:hypothetical protein
MNGESAAGPPSRSKLVKRVRALRRFSGRMTLPPRPDRAEPEDAVIIRIGLLPRQAAQRDERRAIQIGIIRWPRSRISGESAAGPPSRSKLVKRVRALRRFSGVADLSATYRTRIGRAIVSAGPRMTVASVPFMRT